MSSKVRIKLNIPRSIELLRKVVKSNGKKDYRITDADGNGLLFHKILLQNISAQFDYLDKYCSNEVNGLEELKLYTLNSFGLQYLYDLIYMGSIVIEGPKAIELEEQLDVLRLPIICESVESLLSYGPDDEDDEDVINTVASLGREECYDKANINQMRNLTQSKQQQQYQHHQQQQQSAKRVARQSVDHLNQYNRQQQYQHHQLDSRSVNTFAIPSAPPVSTKFNRLLHETNNERIEEEKNDNNNDDQWQTGEIDGEKKKFFADLDLYYSMRPLTRSFVKKIAAEDPIPSTSTSTSASTSTSSPPSAYPKVECYKRISSTMGYQFPNKSASSNQIISMSRQGYGPLSRRLNHTEHINQIGENKSLVLMKQNSSTSIYLVSSEDDDAKNAEEYGENENGYEENEDDEAEAPERYVNEPENDEDALDEDNEEDAKSDNSNFQDEPTKKRKRRRRSSNFKRSRQLTKEQQAHKLQLTQKPCLKSNRKEVVVELKEKSVQKSEPRQLKLTDKTISELARVKEEAIRKINKAVVDALPPITAFKRTRGGVECFICSNLYPVSQWREHILVKHFYNRYYCLKCGSPFTKSYNRDLHSRKCSA